MVLHPYVCLGKNHYGYGLFATSDISAGEVVWYESDSEMTALIVLEKSKLVAFSAYIVERIMRFHWELNLTEISISSWLEDFIFGKTDELLFGENTNYGDFINHSCDPNIWYENDFTQVARRHIYAGEEICQDYATDRAGPFEFRCLCGSVFCRSLIRKNDFDLPELRERYGPHFRSLILQSFQNQSLLMALKNSYPDLGTDVGYSHKRG